jgi:raffinose synthase
MMRLIQGTNTLLFSLFLLIDTVKNANAFNLPIPARTKQKLLLRHMVSHVEPMTAAEGVMQKEDLESIITSGENILQLDESGRLRIQKGPVLLDGLEPNTWTGIPPVHRDNENDQDGCSSLFLQVTHSKERSAQHELSLGSLVTCNRLLACARLTRYWMGPAFGTKADDIPLDTQFLLVEVAENGPYALVLPLVDAGFRTSLEYSKEKEEIGIICYSESGDASVTPDGMKALYVAVGDDPFELVQRGFQEVADNMGTFRTLHEKKIPESVDDFGWCTWDAFYSKVNPAGILEGVSALKKAGVPPRNIILDDGWQEVTPHPSNWKAEEASDEKPGIISRLGNAAFDQAAALFTGYYNNSVKKAPHGTLSNRLWTLLSRTVLKKGLWNFFDSETDFNRQLDGFEPNFKFQASDGTMDSMTLTNLVHELKTELGMKRVYCWHALHGYWRGISSELGDSIGIDVLQIRTEPTEHLMRMEPQMGFDTISLFGVGMITDKEDLAKFYQHLHKPLVAAGVDGVKVDVQSGVSAAGSGVRGVAGGPHIGQIYTEAMEDSVSQHFASETTGAVDCINCMCHSTENLYRYKVTAVARASDDFYPRRPESHSVHLVNVAYNSLFLGEICLPDWDMFQSKHVSAELHGAARAVGGCPVYVSDVPGQHNVHLLKKLVLPDGSVLRAQLPGRPTRDCLFTDVGQDGESALKIWNTNKAGGGVVGAFNVQGVAWNFDTNENEEIDPSPSRVVASVKPHDVESLRTMDGPFAVWKHRSSALEILENGESTIEAPLDSHEWDIFTISPVQSSGDVKWAAIGLGDMLNSGGAIFYQSSLEEVTTTTNTTGDGFWRQTTTASITTRGPGRFVAYCEPAPTTIIINDGMGSIPSELPFAYNEDTQLLEFVLPNEAEENGAHQVTIAWDNPP